MINEKENTRQGPEVGSETVKTPVSVKYVRFIFAILALVLLVFIVVQTFFAGMAVFGEPKFWVYHKTYVGYFHMMVAVMFILSFFGRIKGRIRWYSLGLWAIISFQYMTVKVFSETWMLAALHPVNALLLFWGSMYIMNRSWKWLLLRD
jgi:mercuric ion transport protein